MMGGMMGGCAWGNPGTGTAIGLDQAEQQVDAYLSAWGNPDLALAEVMEFSNNFYAEVEERSTGIQAFELLVNKYSGTVFPEYGPNMMWNLKYSPMAGMMGGGMMGGSGRGRSDRVPTGTDMPVSPDQARADAQKYVDQYYPGATVSKPDAFYGYYTLHTLANDQVTGMLSVNGYTGQVWYHSWHGKFVQMREGD